MNEPRVCPNCQATVPADAPAGVCPACALRAGFDLGDGSDSPTQLTPASPSQPLPVEHLAERLPELEQFELIGRGGMGAVYKARHRKLERPVAVKVLNPVLSGDASFAERFAREARTLAQLDHPNVVRVYDFGNRDDLYYLIMELVDGVSLRQTIENGKIEPPEALTMVPPICEALQYAHNKGVVHRDIKPENILVDRNGSIKIADFGLAKIVGRETEQRLTRTQQIMGTPNYMAPEQIENPGQVDHRADIFALGVVFYELLTGGLPVGRFPPPSKKVQVDVRLDDVVLRTLEKEPNLRYQQASELQYDVESLSSGNLRAAAVPPASAPRPEKQRGYEYRSTRKVFGLPLVHVASSLDPEGKKMSVASGIIAIGDIAIGGLAIGAFSFGGITFGGLGIGLIGFGGVMLGLLTVVAGCAFGGFTIGGLSFGLVAAHGSLPISLMSLTEGALSRVTALGLTIIIVAFITSAAAAIYAWIQVVKQRDAESEADSTN